MKIHLMEGICLLDFSNFIFDNYYKFKIRINYNLFLQPYTIPKDRVAPASVLGNITSRETARDVLTSRLDTNDPLIQKLRYKVYYFTI